MIVSASVAAAMYAGTGSKAMAAAILAAGILLDLDHWVDYWAEYGRRFDVQHFFDSVHYKEFRRAFLVLHTWEGVAVTGVLAWWSGWDPWFSGACLGWGLHLLLDQVGNVPSPWAYFLLWRIWGRFDYQRTFPKPPDARRSRS